MEVLPPASRARQGRALDNDWGLEALEKSQVHVQRPKRKAILLGAAGSSALFFLYKENNIGHRLMSHLSIEALPVSSSLEPEKPLDLNICLRDLIALFAVV